MPDQKSKTCSSCGAPKPLDLFNRDRRLSDGRRRDCAECQRKRMREGYYANRPKWAARAKAYRKTDPERQRTLRQLTYQRHKEKYKAHSRSYWAANKEKRKSKAKEWRKSHPAALRAIAEKRRLAKHNVTGSHTHAQWLSLCKKFHNRCVCCGVSGVPLTKDHVIPLSRPSCTHDISNIQPLCRPCNSRKNDAHTVDYRITPFTGGGQLRLLG